MRGIGQVCFRLWGPAATRPRWSAKDSKRAVGAVVRAASPSIRRKVPQGSHPQGTREGYRERLERVQSFFDDNDEDGDRSDARPSLNRVPLTARDGRLPSTGRDSRQRDGRLPSTCGDRDSRLQKLRNALREEMSVSSPLWESLETDLLKEDGEGGEDGSCLASLQPAELVRLLCMYSSTVMRKRSPLIPWLTDRIGELLLQSSAVGPAAEVNGDAGSCEEIKLPSAGSLCLSLQDQLDFLFACSNIKHRPRHRETMRLLLASLAEAAVSSSSSSFSSEDRETPPSFDLPTLCRLTGALGRLRLAYRDEFADAEVTRQIVEAAVARAERDAEIHAETWQAVTVGHSPGVPLGIRSVSDPGGFLSLLALLLNSLGKLWVVKEGEPWLADCGQRVVITVVSVVSRWATDSRQGVRMEEERVLSLRPDDCDAGVGVESVEKEGTEQAGRARGGNAIQRQNGDLRVGEPGFTSSVEACGSMSPLLSSNELSRLVLGMRTFGGFLTAGATEEADVGAGGGKKRGGCLDSPEGKATLQVLGVWARQVTRSQGQRKVEAKAWERAAMVFAFSEMGLGLSDPHLMISLLSACLGKSLSLLRPDGLCLLVRGIRALAFSGAPRVLLEESRGDGEPLVFKPSPSSSTSNSSAGERKRKRAVTETAEGEGMSSLSTAEEEKSSEEETHRIDTSLLSHSSSAAAVSVEMLEEALETLGPQLRRRLPAFACAALFETLGALADMRSSGLQVHFDLDIQTKQVVIDKGPWVTAEQLLSLENHIAPAFGLSHNETKEILRRLERRRQLDESNM